MSERTITGATAGPRISGAATGWAVDDQQGSPAVEVRYFRGSLPPDEVLALRRQVYVDETGFIPESALKAGQDAEGVHICVYRSGRLLAASHAVEAEKSDFGRHSGLAAAELARAFYVTRWVVDPAHRREGLSKFMIYLQGSEFRQRGRDVLVAYMPDEPSPNREILALEPMRGVKPWVVTGGAGRGQYVLRGECQDLDYAMSRCFRSLPEDLRDLAGRTVIPQEAIATVQSMIDGFYANAWFREVAAGTLTRRQYLRTLGNWHQFVRWTTRLLGRVVAITADQGLRRHYVDHLTGEIDHDRWIERDIAYLGGDVDYVVNHMAPSAPIRTFMALQESLAAFHQDPIVFLGVPFAIEGLSGQLPQAFLDALLATVRSWGYDRPEKGCTFLASHVHTDGAEDGHWRRTKDVIGRTLRTETQLQNFLTVAEIVVKSINAAFEEPILKPDLTVAGPASERPQAAFDPAAVTGSRIRTSVPRPGSESSSSL